MSEEYYESDDDDEEYNDDEEDDDSNDDNEYSYNATYTRNREEVTTGLESRMKDKIISLQEQLIKHAFGDQKLSDNDVIRYSAMLDVLKSMLV